MYSILFIPLIEPPWNFRVCKYHDYNLYRLNEIRRICRKLRKWPWRYIRGFLTSARDDFYDQTCTEETCVCRCEEGGIIFSCSAKGVKSNIWRNGITRDTKSRNNCKRIPSIRSNMYSDLLNGEHFFFFSFLPTRFYCIEISFLENHVFRVKRTIEIPSKSVDLFPFSLTIPNTSNHIFIAQRLSRSKTHNWTVIPIIILFEKTRCDFRKRSNSIDTCLNFINLSLRIYKTTY